MKSNILVNPISNLTDPDEELALALVAHLKPFLNDWRTGRDLRQDILDLETLLPDLNAEAEKLGGSIEKLTESINKALQNYKSKPAIMILSGLILATLLWFSGRQVIGILSGFGLIGFGLFSFKKMKNVLQSNKSEQESDLTKIKEKNQECLPTS